MNYELAERLKDAGFPQLKVAKAVGGMLAPPNYAYPPTLSELISAIEIPEPEVGFFTLAFIRGKWFAGYEKYEVFNPEATGATPEEAVARLWLITR